MVRAGVGAVTAKGLSSDGVLVAVERWSINYKDGLASMPDERVSRISLVPGMNLAATVVETGEPVIAHG